MITINIKVTLDGSNSSIAHTEEFLGTSPSENILLKNLADATGNSGNEFQKILLALCAAKDTTPHQLHGA